MFLNNAPHLVYVSWVYNNLKISFLCNDICDFSSTTGHQPQYRLKKNGGTPSVVSVALTTFSVDKLDEDALLSLSSLGMSKKTRLMHRGIRG